MLRVPERCDVFKIAESIVGFDGIYVIDFHAGWARPDECGHDEFMDRETALLAVAAENDMGVTSRDAGPQDVPRTRSLLSTHIPSHPAQVAHRIPAFVPDDCFPVLFHTGIDAKTRPRRRQWLVALVTIVTCRPPL